MSQQDDQKKRIYEYEQGRKGNNSSGSTHSEKGYREHQYKQEQDRKRWASRLNSAINDSTRSEKATRTPRRRSTKQSKESRGNGFAVFVVILIVLWVLSKM